MKLYLLTSFPSSAKCLGSMRPGGDAMISSRKILDWPDKQDMNVMTCKYPIPKSPPTYWYCASAKSSAAASPEGVAAEKSRATDSAGLLVCYGGASPVAKWMPMQAA